MSKLEQLRIKELPIMPQVAAKILQLQEEHLEISFKELERIILMDPALTAKILKVANSSLYSRQKEIANLQQAITLLGFKIIKSLVLLVCASNLFGKSSTSKSAEVELWRHLILTSFLSKSLALRLGKDEIQEDAFISGLLHDVGRIVILLNNEEEYISFLQSLDNRKKIFEAEEELFGYNHGEIGKAVLEQWNFPDELVDVVELHHSINITSRYKDLIMIVGLANIYAKSIADEPVMKEDPELKAFYYKALNVDTDVDEYFTIGVLEDLEKDALYSMSSMLV